MFICICISLSAHYLFSRIQIRFIIHVNERTMCVDDSNYPVCLIVSNYGNFCEEKEREEGRILAHAIIRHSSYELQTVVCSELSEENSPEEN